MAKALDPLTGASITDVDAEHSWSFGIERTGDNQGFLRMGGRFVARLPSGDRVPSRDVSVSGVDVRELFPGDAARATLVHEVLLDLVRRAAYMARPDLVPDGGADPVVEPLPDSVTESVTDPAPSGAPNA